LSRAKTQLLVNPKPCLPPTLTVGRIPYVRSGPSTVTRIAEAGATGLGIGVGPNNPRPVPTLLTYVGCSAFPISARRGFTAAIWCCRQKTRVNPGQRTGGGAAILISHQAFGRTGTTNAQSLPRRRAGAGHSESVGPLSTFLWARLTSRA